MNKVTERDFRKDEFKDARVEDYEFRGDGEVVRKDRWEKGIYRIKNIMIPECGEFEIDDLVKMVEDMKQSQLS